jgi:flagellar hook-basal body protein
MSAVVPAQTGGVRIALGAGAVAGTQVNLQLNGASLDSVTVTATDIANGYVTYSSPGLTSAAGLSASYVTQKATVPLTQQDLGQVVQLKDADGNLLGSKTITTADLQLGRVDFMLNANTSVEGLQVGLISTGLPQAVDSVIGIQQAGAQPADTDPVRVDWSTAPPLGRVVQLMDGETVLQSKIITQADIDAGYVDFNKPTSNFAVTAQTTMRFLTSGDYTAQARNVTTTPDQVMATPEYRKSYLQGVSINSKGLIKATYGDGSSFDIGFIALATFRNDSALKPTGNTNFIATGDSGDATLVQAGAPAAGDILSGTLEQANVDITQELMTMLRAQQVYNGNARMMQTAVEVASRITDKL